MSTDLATKEAKVASLPKAVVHDEGLFFNLMDTSRFEHLQRVSKVFANSALVPEHFRGKEADCFIAVEMAMRLKLHPFNLMQSLYVVHGKPGIEAKMAIALVNSSGIFEAPLQWEFKGEGMDREVVCRATHAKSRQLCEARVSMAMAKAEGWIDKSGSKWKTLPDLMLQYRSASFFARLYCPEVIFGMQTTDELHDTPEIDVTPAADAKPIARGLKAKLGIETVVVEPEPVREERGSDMVNTVTGEISQTTRDSAPAVQEPAGAARGTPVPETTSEAPKAVQEPAKAPAMAFSDLLGYAKKAKNAAQAATVRETAADAAYTDEERKQIEDVLGKKTFAPE